ncbi:MAG: thiamine phosphate synthase [Inquilinus sp.]|nr:thiamine phosphate synthase [Inquilinus sp.]
MTASQLYLLTPAAIEPAAFAADLAAALDTGEIASVLLLPESVGGDAGALRQAVDILRPVAQERDVAFLVDGHPALAADTGCDGVHTCPDGPSYKEARLAVGPQAIVGYSARFSRHTAMIAAEQGADYVAFGRRHPSPAEVAETLDLVGWWAALMEVPCAALGDIRPETCAPLVAAGADFLAVDAAIWQHPRGPAAGVDAMMSAIEAAARR